MAKKKWYKSKGGWIGLVLGLVLMIIITKPFEPKGPIASPGGILNWLFLPLGFLIGKWISKGKGRK